MCFTHDSGGACIKHLVVKNLHMTWIEGGLGTQDTKWLWSWLIRA